MLLDLGPLHIFHHLWQAKSMCGATGPLMVFDYESDFSLIMDITLVFSFAKFKARYFKFSREKLGKIF